MEPYPVIMQSTTAGSLFRLFAPGTAVGVAFNVLIFGLFFFGMALVAVSWQSTTREWQFLRQIGTGLERLTPSDRIQSSTAQLFSHFGVIHDDLPKLLSTNTGRRMSAVLNVQAGGKEAVVELMNIFDAREDNRPEFLRFLVSILVLLGLAGTILSMRGIINQLNASFAAATGGPQSPVHALVPMKSAFSCTLAGIITSVLLAFCLNRIETKRSKLKLDSEELVYSRIIPLFYPPMAHQPLEVIREVFTDTQLALKNFTVSLATSGKVYEETLYKAIEKSSWEFRDTLTQSADALISSAEEMKAAAKAIVLVTSDLLEARQDLIAERQHVLDNMKETSNTLTDLATRTLEPLQVAATSIRKSEVTASQILDSVHDYQTRFDNLQQQMRQSMVDNGERLVAAIGDYSLKVDASLMQVRDASVENSTSTANLSAAMVMLRSAIMNEVGDLPAGVTLGSIFEQTTETLNSMRGPVTELEQETTLLTREMKKLTKRLMAMSALPDPTTGSLAPSADKPSNDPLLSKLDEVLHAIERLPNQLNNSANHTPDGNTAAPTRPSPWTSILSRFSRRQ